MDDLGLQAQDKMGLEALLHPDGMSYSAVRSDG
jgi:hypothetical protein